MEAGVLAVGVGMMGNYHSGLPSAGQRSGGAPIFDVGLDARRDPCAGASTDYRGVFRNEEVLAAGDEIFLDYGEGW